LEKYYARGNEWFSDLTLCCIYKTDKQEFIDYINKFLFKLNPPG